MADRSDNLHGCALVLGDRGVIVTGASGSGKTALALALVARGLDRGRFAALVADDRVDVTVRFGRLLCSAPEAIAGLVEIRGRTPRAVEIEPRAVVDLLVRLVPESAAPRYAEDATQDVLGVAVPCLALAERNVNGAIAAIASVLGQRPFT